MVKWMGEQWWVFVANGNQLSRWMSSSGASEHVKELVNECVGSGRER